MKFTIRALTLPVLSFEYRLFKPWSQRKLERFNQELAKLQPLIEAYLMQRARVQQRPSAAEQYAEAWPEAPITGGPEPVIPVDTAIRVVPRESNLAEGVEMCLEVETFHGSLDVELGHGGVRVYRAADDDVPGGELLWSSSPSTDPVDAGSIFEEAKKAKELTDHAYEAGKKAAFAEAAAATRERRGELQLASYIDCIQEDDDSITLLVETDNGRFRVETGHHGERAVIVCDDDDSESCLWSSLTDVG